MVGWLKLNRYDIRYTDVGEGDPIVMVHGLGGNASTWLWHIQELSKYYRVLAYDSVNHGFSENSPRNIDEPDRADELEQFLEAIGIDRPVLMGQSMGGMTILRWLYRHQNQARCAIISGAGWPIDVSSPPRAFVDGDLEQILVGVGGSFTPNFVKDNHDVVARYIRLRSTATRIEAERFPRQMSFSNPPWSGYDDSIAEGFKKVLTPTLFFVGDQDFFFSAAETAQKLLPNSTLEISAGVAHNAYFERMDEFVGLVKSFISSNP